jgi:APA family basic amino acid/polyamine antiporter
MERIDANLPVPELRRVLGPIDAVSIVIGAVIGVGIFFTPSLVARIAGSGSVALSAWVLGALIALLGALSFAELGGTYTRSAGQYEVLRDAYGPLTGFVFVFCNATAIQTGSTAIIAVICVRHLCEAIGVAIDPVSVSAMGGVLIACVAVANIFSVRIGAGIQVITVVAKIFALLAVTWLAVWVAPTIRISEDPHEGSPSSLGPVAALLAALVPAAYSYGGWQQLLWMGGEVRDAQRNVPRAIVMGMIIVGVAYVSANWGYLQLLGMSGVAASHAPAADAVAKVWHGSGPRAVAAAVAISAFGVLNAQLLSGPRLIYGMARDGRFFVIFRRVHPRWGTPLAAIALIAGLALALLFLAGQRAVENLLTGIVAIDSLFFILTAGAIFILRRRHPDAPRPVRTPGYPVVPLLFLVCETVVLFGAFIDAEVRSAAFIGAAWVAFAASFYFVFFRR